MTQPAKPVFLGISAPPMMTPENPAFGFPILLALHLPGDAVAFVITHFSLNLFTLPQEKLNLSPMNVAAYEEVSNYLADMRPYSWISFAPTLSSEAQTALTIALLRLTLKLTGAKLPRGKMHTEVVTYLALIQVGRQQYLVDCPKISFLFSIRTLWTRWLGARTGRRPPRTTTLTRCTPTSPKLSPISR